MYAQLEHITTEQFKIAKDEEFLKYPGIVTRQIRRIDSWRCFTVD